MGFVELYRYRFRGDYIEKRSFSAKVCCKNYKVIDNGKLLPKYEVNKGRFEVIRPIPELWLSEEDDDRARERFEALYKTRGIRCKLEVERLLQEAKQCEEIITALRTVEMKV